MDKRRNHIIFWVGYFVYFYIYAILLLTNIIPQWQIFIATFISVLLAATSFYILIAYIHHYIFSRNKRINAILGIIILGFLIASIYCSIIYYLSIIIPQIMITINLKNSFMFMFSRYIIAVYISVAYYLFKEFQIIWIANRKAEIRTYELQKTISQTELLVLKNQINPHFFYNILNFLYSQSLQSFRKLSNPILTLSEMMRYSITEGFENDKVSLENEINYLQNFIKLENLQNNRNAKIRLSVVGNPQYRRITPLCLVPLIENIYRYSEINNKEEYINAILEIHEDKLNFSSKYKKKSNVIKELIEDDSNKIKQELISKYSNNSQVQFNLMGQFYTLSCTISL